MANAQAKRGVAARQRMTVSSRSASPAMNAPVSILPSDMNRIDRPSFAKMSLLSSYPAGMKGRRSHCNSRQVASLLKRGRG